MTWQVAPGASWKQQVTIKGITCSRALAAAFMLNAGFSRTKYAAWMHLFA
jgi:hypothetical protein